ncbi:MAG: hypothetical protein AAF514_19570, partial [Verrucomicrobiota bacterium]
MKTDKLILILAAYVVAWAIPTKLTADTLLLELNAVVTSKQIDIPEKYDDLNKTFDSIPGNGDFTLRVIVPGFEKYSEGSHTVSLNLGNDLNYGKGRDTSPKIAT